MAIFRKCARCFNEDGGDNIFQCNACGLVFCQVCEDANSSEVCPTCKGEGRQLGSIEFPDDD